MLATINQPAATSNRYDSSGVTEPIPSFYRNSLFVLLDNT